MQRHVDWNVGEASISRWSLSDWHIASILEVMGNNFLRKIMFLVMTITSPNWCFLYFNYPN